MAVAHWSGAYAEMSKDVMVGTTTSDAAQDSLPAKTCEYLDAFIAATLTYAKQGTSYQPASRGRTRIVITSASNLADPDT